MATFAWDLDAAGAAAGDEVTVTAGNAGTDGPTSVNSVTGGTRVFDNAQAPPGLSWAVRLATGATSGTSNMVWGATRIPNTTVGYFRIPLHFSEMLSNRSLARVRSSGTQILRVHRTADGRLELRNSGNSSVASGSVSMPEDTWVELGIFADPGNTSTCRIRWWLWGAAVADFEDEVSATDNFSATAAVNELTVGNIAAGSSIPDYWVGPVRYSDAGWPGPLSTVHDAASPLDGVGSLTGSAARTRSGLVVVGGVGGLAAAGAAVRASAAALTGAAAVTAAATAARAAAANLAGTAGLDAAATTARAATTDLAGTAALAATATAGLVAATSLAGTADLDAAAAVASPIGVLVDDFDDGSIDTGLWPGNYGDVAEVGGRLRIDCDVTQWSGAKSATRYFLTGTGVHVQVWPPAAGGATVAYLSVLVTTTTPGTDAGFNIDAGSNGIAFLLREGFSDADAVFATYSPTDHAWLRLSEAAGTLTWETSPDGLTWTVRRTAATPTWAADGDLALLAESHRDAGVDDYAELDNLNVTPAAVHDAAAGLDAVGALAGAVDAARAGSGTLAGVAALSGTATAGRSAMQALAGVAGLDAAAAAGRAAAAGLAVAGVFAVAADAGRSGVAPLAGAGALTGTATVVRQASATLAAVGVLDAAGTVTALTVPGRHTAGATRSTHTAADVRPAVAAGSIRPGLVASLTASTAAAGTSRPTHVRG